MTCKANEQLPSPLTERAAAFAYRLGITCCGALASLAPMGLLVDVLGLVDLILLFVFRFLTRKGRGPSLDLLLDPVFVDVGYRLGGIDLLDHLASFLWHRPARPPLIISAL